MSQTATLVRTIPEAAKYARAFSADERIQLVKSTDRLQAAVEHLYGLEEAARPVLERTLAMAQALSKHQDLELAYFDLTPLTWRNGDGWPSFGIFGLKDPRCKFNYVGQRGTGQRIGTIPKLPDSYQDCYVDLAKRFQKEVSTWDNCSITARFSGLLPLDVKAKIEAARPLMQDIFVLAEVPKWDVKREVLPRIGDPLVLGFDGQAT